MRLRGFAHYWSEGTPIQDPSELFRLRVQYLLHDESWGFLLAGLRFTGLKTILNIALVCMDIHSKLKPILEECFTFRLVEGRQITRYSPKRLLIQSIPNSSRPTLPHNITHMTITGIFYYFNNKRYLPQSLQQLNVDDFLFNGQLSLPDNLTHLYTAYSFNQPIDCLPPNLTHFYVSNLFNQPINFLPETLSHLSLGHNFNQPIDYLPSRLTHLTLGEQFNFPVDYLPSVLKYIALSKAFKQPLDHLPNSIEILQLVYGEPLCLSYLPPSVTHLQCSAGLCDNLPATIVHLAVNSCPVAIDNLPSSITHLIMLRVFHAITLDHLPSSITHLSIPDGNNVENYLDYLPSSLVSLSFGYRTICPLDNLPESLSQLIIRSETYPHNLDHLPNSLKHLEIHSNTPLDNLPGGLNSLMVRASFNQPLDHLPESIISLRINCKPQYSCPLHYLPKSLKHLYNY